MSGDWSTYFPFAAGASLTFEGEAGVGGNAEVLERTSAKIAVRFRIPPALDVTLEIDGYRVKLVANDAPPTIDDAAVITSDPEKRLRVVTSSISFQGQPLTLRIQNTNDGRALVGLNGQTVTLSSAPVTIPTQPQPMHVRPPKAAEEAQKITAGPRYEDWSRIVSFEPKLYVRPTSLKELKGFLSSIAQGLIEVSALRAPGSMHSCSTICVSDAIVDLRGLPREIGFNADNSVVTLTANWTLHDFLEELSKVGKSLLATGGTDHQTLAGLISTNTAPATPKYGMYAAIDWIEYLTIDPATKTVVERKVESTDPTFRCVIGSLGAIGIITRLQMRVVDQRFFETVQKVVPIDSLLDDLDATSKKYDFWRVDWIPDTKKGLMWAATQIPEAQAPPNGDYEKDAAVNVLDFVFKLWDRVSGGAAGPLLDGTMRAIYWAMAAVYGETRAKGPMRNMLPVDRRVPLRVAMAEWGFHPDDRKRVIACARTYFEQHGWPNIPIEIELSKTDSYAMSAWNWEGLPYVIKFNFMYLTDICTTDAERELIHSHLRGLWNAFLAAGIRFKAHWGKINFLDPAYVKAAYDVAAFKPLVHPLFVNGYLARRIG